MSAGICEEWKTIFPHFESGMQLREISGNYPLISLCGGGATRNEKIAFVCQYADACQQKILLLDECGVLFPKHRVAHKKMSLPIQRAMQKIGLLDVLRGATFGKKAEYYATAWCNSQALAGLEYQHVFIATEQAINPWSRAAIVFPERNKRKNMRLFQSLYDMDVVILGIAGKQDK